MQFPSRDLMLVTLVLVVGAAPIAAARGQSGKGVTLTMTVSVDIARGATFRHDRWESSQPAAVVR